MDNLENLGLSVEKLNKLSAQELARSFINTTIGEKEKRQEVLKYISKKDVEFQNEFYTFSSNPDLIPSKKF